MQKVPAIILDFLLSVFGRSLSATYELSVSASQWNKDV